MSHVGSPRLFLLAVLARRRSSPRRPGTAQTARGSKIAHAARLEGLDASVRLRCAPFSVARRGLVLFWLRQRSADLQTHPPDRLIWYNRSRARRRPVGLPPAPSGGLPIPNVHRAPDLAHRVVTSSGNGERDPGQRHLDGGHRDRWRSKRRGSTSPPNGSHRPVFPAAQARRRGQPETASHRASRYLRRPPFQPRRRFPPGTRLPHLTATRWAIQRL